MPVTLCLYDLGTDNVPAKLQISKQKHGNTTEKIKIKRLGLYYQLIGFVFQNFLNIFIFLC